MWILGLKGLKKKKGAMTGRHLSLEYGHVILVDGYTVFKAVNHNTDVKQKFIKLQAPTLARKCEI